MIKIKLFLISFFSFLFFCPNPFFGGEDGVGGWYEVERIQGDSLSHEVDPSIWALFVKDLEIGRLQVRLPGEPVYQYTPEGALEISSSQEGERFQLLISQEGEGEGSLVTESEGHWIYERFFRKGPYFYHFKTISASADSKNHERFISSFSIENNGSFGP